MTEPPTGNVSGSRARGERTVERVRGVLPSVGVAAAKLRQTLTPAERVLWDALKGQRLDALKFRRQHAVGAFILDFYCASHKLAIEVDGSVHDDPTQIERDMARTSQLQAYGYHLLRFRNEQVVDRLPSVLERILAEASGIEATKQRG